MRETDRETDRETERQRERQTDRQRVQEGKATRTNVQTFRRLPTVHAARNRAFSFALCARHAKVDTLVGASCGFVGP